MAAAPERAPAPAVVAAPAPVSGGALKLRGAGPGTAEAPIVDVDLLTDYAGFVVRSVRRHWRGAGRLLGLTLLAVALVLAVWPRTYQIDGRLLVQNTSLVSSLVNPDRIATREGRVRRWPRRRSSRAATACSRSWCRPTWRSGSAPAPRCSG
ncbi:MAG: hypothetical protein R2708_25250 [Vicinamibacterales bacterium]